MRSDLAGREGAAGPVPEDRRGERGDRELSAPDRTARRLAASLAAGTTLAAVAVAGPWASSVGDEAGESFQRMTGGLGVSRVLDASECGAAFDPRAGIPCREEFAPEPGGRRFCRHRGGAFR